MLQKIFVIGLILSWIHCAAAERTITIPTNCDSFKSCVQKSTNTDIYRNKIRYLDGALHFWKPSDGEQAKVFAIIDRSEYIILEAGGETGYKGDEINLKVSHKKDYKQTSYKSAISDLTEILKTPKLIGKHRDRVDQLMQLASSQLGKL
ncbi:hypothetical protein [Leptospira sp. GIMC2001]|uniref:hypothetical protein n=1 Tax=Leptospira sp. GIMC2001 TaxID=1513297 RepID=UPI00234AFC76|nr:hypothetical protein [Leptospira sp. GIMC2001]WCL47725.1 hypothetical protein O4O04_00275 [Leptospira sp. GIMC2001]